MGELQRDSIDRLFDSFFCPGCLKDKPAIEQSPDSWYCQGCYDFLLHIKYANSYALEAERKMGQLIKQGQDSGIVRERGRYPKSNTGEPLEITELGLTKRESAEMPFLRIIINTMCLSFAILLASRHWREGFYLPCQSQG